MKHVLLFSRTPPFFTEIAALLIGGALVAYLVHRVRLIPIIGFLIAGVLIGPNGLGEQANANSEQGQVQLGLLIFQDLAIIVMVMLVPMLSPTPSSDGSGASLFQILWALGKAGAIILLVLLIARRVMPKILEVVSRICSHEIFLLTIIAICFGTAYLTSLAGVSLSLGAFLAGLVVSESKFSNHALSEIMPLQTLFSAIFFVSVGMLLNLGFLIEHLPLVLLAIVLILAVKVVTTAVSVRALGYATPTAMYSALMLAQIGEFSFVLERIGREVGLFPAGLEAGGSQAFIAATVALMALTPALGSVGSWISRRLRQESESADTQSATFTAHAQPQGKNQTTETHLLLPRLENHVVIAGYGDLARQFAYALQRLNAPFVVVTLSPSGASDAEASGYSTLRGDSSKQHILQQVGVERAKSVFILDDEIAQAARVVSAARLLNASAFIVVRTRFLSDKHELIELGADRVIVDETLPIDAITESLTQAMNISQEALSTLLQRGTSPDEGNGGTSSRNSPTSNPPPSSNLITFHTSHPTCTHLSQIRAVVPSAQGCEACLKTGEKWVHLRICMTCGHVGCCDSSKHKHASKHAEETGHSIMRSFELGETWGWCYTDKIRLEEIPEKNSKLFSQ